MVMLKMAEGRILLVCAFVFVYTADISCADVSSTACTSGGTECNSIHNASCDTGLKCKCDQGYKETTTICTAIGLGETCSVVDDCKTVAHSECKSTTCACLHGYTQISGACVKANVTSTACTSGGTECNSIHNASCDTGLKCKCDQGYKETTTTCTAIGLGDKCSAAGDCKAVANSKCATTCACADGYTKINNACVKVSPFICQSACPDITYFIHNSACTSGNCACANGYEENNNICSAAVSSTTCTSGGNECDAIGNAQCDTNLHKCKCDQGYKENKDACEAIESGAVSMKSAVGLVFGSMILLLIQAL